MNAYVVYVCSVHVYVICKSISVIVANELVEKKVLE